MNIPEVVQTGTPALHTSAAEVPVADITSTEIQEIIQGMKLALAGEPDGVAIAAPQINVSKRIFVVAGSVFGKNELDIAFINPVITKKSKKSEIMDEGCLSVRYIYGNVKRYLNVSIEAYDEQGQKIKRGAGGLLAHVFQHEIDHLDGILFTDKATSTNEMTDKEKKHLDRKCDDAKDELTK